MLPQSPLPVFFSSLPEYRGRGEQELCFGDSISTRSEIDLAADEAALRHQVQARALDVAEVEPLLELVAGAEAQVLEARRRVVDADLGLDSRHGPCSACGLGDRDEVG